MNFDDYQDLALRTAVYPDVGSNLFYPTLGLASEAGEVAGVIKKVHRDCGDDPAKYRDNLRKELGGVLWYVAALCSELGLSMGDVAEHNLGTLSQRQDEGTLQGGDADDFSFTVTQQGKFDLHNRTFSHGSVKMKEGERIRLHLGELYGTDPQAHCLVGSAALVWDDTGYYAGDIRIAASAKFTVDQFRQAVDGHGVRATLEGEVEHHEQLPDGGTRVLAFNPALLRIDIPNLSPDTDIAV
jgi:NTP pyrophosphatase (non-canonical NTP hydrolase)